MEKKKTLKEKLQEEISIFKIIKEISDKRKSGTYTSNETANTEDYTGEKTTAHDLVEQSGDKTKGNRGQQEVVKETTTSSTVISEQITDIIKPKIEKGGERIGASETMATIIEEENVPPAEEDAVIPPECPIEYEDFDWSNAPLKESDQGNTK